jgi:hypothetical protein
VIRSRSLILWFVLAVSVALASCTSDPPNGPVVVSIAPGLQPRLTPDDAEAISRAYLDQQTPEIAAPELHIAAHITNVWAVAKSEAWALDGCIPSVAGDGIVWVTRGQGDYLNFAEHPWSGVLGFRDQVNPDETRLRCLSPGPVGTLVIDDATGSILGVYPGNGGDRHPSPRP